MDFKIQWFPGHMTKAKRMMETQLKLVDVVIEMLDARIPRSSTNPMLLEMLGNKPKLVALNKIDMADPVKTDTWLQIFKNNGLTVVKVDCATGKGIKQLISAVQEIAKPVSEKWAKKGVKNRPIRVMIVGVPNVGKSTLINRLVGKNKVIAADRPGVTRGQQWITIAKGLELLDTPGVLWPKFQSDELALNLVYIGSIRDDIVDKEDVCLKLIEKLSKDYPKLLEKRYKIEIQDTPLETMEAIAIKRGAIFRGKEIDYRRVSDIVMDEFKKGTIGNITLERL